MEFIHVRNLEKYHPGYKDRTLQWGKIYFKMVQGDPDCEMIENEVDWGRLVKIILLELQAQKPLPNIDAYWVKKGFNVKKRPMSLTLKMLHNFLATVCKSTDTRHVDKDKDKEKEEEVMSDNRVTEFFNYFLLKTGKTYALNTERRKIIESRLKEGRALDELKKAVDNFIQDEWSDRHKFIDIIYCIGTRNKIDNLERWLNSKQQPKRRLI